MLYDMLHVLRVSVACPYGMPMLHKHVGPYCMSMPHENNHERNNVPKSEIIMKMEMNLDTEMGSDIDMDTFLAQLVPLAEWTVSCEMI
jgi:hypothetical protein